MEGGRRPLLQNCLVTTVLALTIKVWIYDPSEFASEPTAAITQNSAKTLNSLGEDWSQFLLLKLVIKGCKSNGARGRELENKLPSDLVHEFSLVSLKKLTILTSRL